MIKNFFLDLAYLLLAWQFLRGFIELLNLRKSLKWLYRAEGSIRRDANATSPFFYILLPVLREQKLLEQTVENFLTLSYPKDLFKIIVITTEKETYEKEIGRNRISLIAKALADKISKNVFMEKYIGLFDEKKMLDVYTKYIGKNYFFVNEKLMRDCDNYLTTIELAEKLKQKINTREKKSIIETIHYPFKEGVMAHQVNYAVEHLKPIKNKKTFIGLYNADSSPNADTLMNVAKVVSNSGENVILQQSAIFTKNFNLFNHSWKSSFLKSGGLLQSHWTLCHEIPRIRAQSQSVKKLSKSKLGLFLKTRLAHCVGHGMFINLDLFKELGNFSTETMNEDLPFGFKVCAKKIPIYLLPVLEAADTPETIKHLINQKRIWFWSYLDYWKCRKLLLNSNFADPTIINSLTLQGLLFGFAWLFNSILYLFPAVISIIYFNKLVLVLSIFSLLLFYFLPISIIMLNLNKLHSKADKQLIKINSYDWILIQIFGLFALFSDSLGPWLTIFDKLKVFVTGVTPYKQKTER